MGATKYIVGGLLGISAIALVVRAVSAKGSRGVTVTLVGNPLNMIVLVDGKTKVVTPGTITLSSGRHTFAAPLHTDAMLPAPAQTYQFMRWDQNKIPISRSPTVSVLITKNTTLTAQYMLAQYGVYPITAINPAVGEDQAALRRWSG